MAYDVLTAVLAEQERRSRAQRKELGPKYDWYGPDCGCPPDRRRPGGSCPDHPRARPEQHPPPGNWQILYYECGRGWGKTITGAQWVIEIARRYAKAARIALVAPTAADIRDVMVEGPTGIKSISPPWFDPLYEPTKRRVSWPNGARAQCYTAEEPERLRGPQFSHAWIDEVATWDKSDAFDMLMLGLRLGTNPQVLLTTTPKPKEWLRKIKERARRTLSYVRGSTYDNRDNLAQSFFSDIITKYEGTRLGRQELEAEDLEDVPGALWTTSLLDRQRIDRRMLPAFDRIVVSVDPSVADPDATDDEIAECGIIVSGTTALEHPTLGLLPNAFVLADRSMRGHPSEWGRAVVNAYQEFAADVVVAEANNGGALVENNLKAIDPNVPVTLVHAARAKITRAEPIASLYEQRRCWHILSSREDFAELERQLCNWVPGLKSPDRLDALVWGITELLLDEPPLQAGANPYEDWRGT